MSTRRIAVVAIAAGIALSATPAAFAASVTPPPAALAAADKGADWLAAHMKNGYYPGPTGQPDPSATANAVLALAAADRDPKQAIGGLQWLESHVDAYVKDSKGVDQAGQLATLILVAHSAGLSPTSFGTTHTDLVARLVATQRTTGADQGLFGAQDPTYDGAYRQGLALLALTAAGRHNASGISWLEAQQCANGTWMAYRPNTSTACPPTDPSSYSGPDTNDTALAFQGLVAQNVKLSKTPLSWLASVQNADAGWAYYPGAGQASDPDSTAVVTQAIIAGGQNPTAWAKGSKTPYTALMSFQLPSGAFFFPGSTTPNAIATEQEVPALAGKAFPLPYEATAFTLPKATPAPSATPTPSPTPSVRATSNAAVLPRTGATNVEPLVVIALLAVGLGVVTLVVGRKTRG